MKTIYGIQRQVGEEGRRKGGREARDKKLSKFPTSYQPKKNGLQINPQSYMSQIQLLSTPPRNTSLEMQQKEAGV